MLISLKLAQQMLAMVTVLIAYFVTVSLAGYVRAWSAHKAGDDTPASLGFLTLNPLVHMDLIGLFLLFFFRAGWGRQIPINYMNITYPWRMLKLMAVHFSDCIVHIILALSSMLTLILVFGSKVLLVVQPLVQHSVVSHRWFAESFPQASPLCVALALILVAMLFLNIFLAALSFIINTVSVVAALSFGESFRDWQYADLALLVAPVLLLYIFMERLWQFVWIMLVVVATLICGA